MYVYTYVHIYIHWYIMNIYACICTQLNMPMYMYVFLYIHICIYISLYTYIHVCMYRNIYIYWRRVEKAYQQQNVSAGDSFNVHWLAEPLTWFPPQNNNKKGNAFNSLISFKQITILLFLGTFVCQALRDILGKFFGGAGIFNFHCFCISTNWPRGAGTFLGHLAEVNQFMDKRRIL